MVDENELPRPDAAEHAAMTAAGGLVARPLTDLPERMRARIMRRRLNVDPARQDGEYDILRW